MKLHKNKIILNKYTLSKASKHFLYAPYDKSSHVFYNYVVLAILDYYYS